MTPDWLIPIENSIAQAHASARLPHALLIHEAPGAGGQCLARWIAQLVLCTRAGRRSRAAAAWVASGSRTCSIRTCSWFARSKTRSSRASSRCASSRRSLRSPVIRAATRSAILSPADALNRFAANALLKTLEEPPARTLLILVASQPSRLPATILSRCQTHTVRAPTRAAASNGCRRRKGRATGMRARSAWAMRPSSPPKADPKAIPQLGARERAAARRYGQRRSAIRWRPPNVGVARRLALRLRCFENWLTERIRVRCFPASGR